MSQQVTHESSVQSIFRAAEDSLINGDHIANPTQAQIDDRAKTLCVEYGLPQDYCNPSNKMSAA